MELRLDDDSEQILATCDALGCATDGLTIEQALENLTEAMGVMIGHYEAAIETEREEETGRWIADLPEIPGCMVYGTTEAEARSKVMALAFQILVERWERPSAMDPEKRPRLEAAGWKVGDAGEFLELANEEAAIVRELERENAQVRSLVSELDRGAK